MQRIFQQKYPSPLLVFVAAVDVVNVVIGGVIGIVNVDATAAVDIVIGGVMGIANAAVAVVDVVIGVIGIDNFVVATAFIIVGVSGAIIVLLLAVVVVIEVQCKYVNELGHYLSPISHPRIAIIYRAVSYGTHVLRHCY